MASAKSLILHHYDTSPFSEKIRLALRLKNLAWTSVTIPNIMPKPDLLALTGGYRRTPVLQIGADIFCDTSLMLIELERRYQIPTLALPGHEGLSRMIGAWVDYKWFQSSVGVIFGEIGEHVPQEFIDDRTELSGRPFDVEGMKAAAPIMRDQWLAQLMWIERRLDMARQAGTGDWLIGTKPGLVDVQAHMNIWFVERSVPTFLESCFEEAPLTRDWYSRLKAISGQDPEVIEAEESLSIAFDAAPSLKAASTEHDLRDFEPGDRVAVAPDDYGRDWVEGDLVIANSERIIIARSDPRADHVHVHFPRVGYMLREA